jgi:Ca-activated chloride channel family protein
VALARAGQADAAREALLGASASEDHAVAADALYNVGNTFLGQKKPKEAVESYLKSLDIDPNDPDARRNLEIALRRLEQQQKQQQQNKQDDQKKDQAQKQDQKPDQKQEPKEQPKDQPQEDQQPQPSSGDSTQTMPDRLTREDAERLLNAIQSDEMKVLGQVRRKEDPKEVPARDW